MRLVLPLLALCAVLLSACEAPMDCYVAGDPIENAKVHLRVGDRDSIDSSSATPKAFRRIHVEWEIVPKAFERYPHLLAVGARAYGGKDRSRLDTLLLPIGQVDFLWECPKHPLKDTFDCSRVNQQTAEVFALMPTDLLLLVASDWQTP